MKDPGGGGEEGEEEPDEAPFGTGGAGLFNGDCGRLEGGKGGRLCLHLHLGLLELADYLLVDLLLHIHLISKFR